MSDIAQNTPPVEQVIGERISELRARLGMTLDQLSGCGIGSWAGRCLSWQRRPGAPGAASV
jgi:hypothetical protein